MLWVWVLGILAALLLLLCLTRVGAEVSFSGGGAVVDVRVGLFHFRVFPGKEKGEEEKPKKKMKPEKPGKGKMKITFSDVKEAVGQLWPPLKRALRRTRRGILVKPLRLSLVLGGEEDPAKTAQLYGELQAGIWNGMPVLEKLLRIPDPRIHTGVDFTAAKTEAEGSVGITIRIGTLLAVAFGVGIPALRWLLRFRKRQRKQTERPAEAAA